MAGLVKENGELEALGGGSRNSGLMEKEKHKKILQPENVENKGLFLFFRSSTD